VSGSSSAEIGGGFGILSQGSIYEQRLTELMARVSTAVERNENRLEEQDRREAIALEWKQLALVCDRFLAFFLLNFSLDFQFSRQCSQDPIAHVRHHHNRRHLRRAHLVPIRSVKIK
jgi:hypothetical protein